MMIMLHRVFSCSSIMAVFYLYLFLFSLLPMGRLRIGSLNINGGRDRCKRALVTELVKQKNVDILFLQETHSDSRNEVDWGIWWEGQCRLSHGTNLSGGVAVLFNRRCNPKVLSTIELVRGRCLIVRAEIEGYVYCFVSIYAHNQGADRLSFFNTLRDELLKYNHEQLIIGGDWNSTEDFTMDRNSEEPHLQSSRALSRIVTQLDIVDAWRLKHPNTRQYTWVKATSGRVSAARLDRFYISQTLVSSLVSSSIIPVGFTDHHLVTTDLFFSPGQKIHTYWHFNNKLLQDTTFCQSFEQFWLVWQSRKSRFDSLGQWWEVGKAQLRVFCQQYTAHSTASIKAAVQQLEDSIKNIEAEINTNHDSAVGGLLQAKRLELNTFMQERVKGALVRSRFLNIKDMDAPSSFFFSLEKSAARSKLMTSLKLPDGRVTMDPKEMRSHAVSFYSDLFRAEECDSDCAAELLEGLPQLSPEEKTSLDRELSFDELTEAVGQMASGKAPGLDGLTIDFFKRFWITVGRDLHSVLVECMDNGVMPTSCRRAALSLLPKKGDLALLKNWRPVALLCTDYKILSRAMSNRLTHCLDMIIQPDQTYCVQGRTIMDNLFLLRDVLELCKLYKLDTGIVSIDQQKAFDMVDHGYLFAALKAFGFGDVFISWVGLLYRGAECLVKVGGGLSRPIPVQRGIRQGCPISGQLYSLVIEPLLCRLRSRLSGLTLPGTQFSPLVVSAYADDLNVFIADQRDVAALQDSLAVYEKASSARVNWGKSEALQVGQWEGRAVPRLPTQLQWKTGGLKVLGVFLGTEEFQGKNWEGVMEKVCARLSSWKWLLPQLSYRGRVLVANNLVASMLWHRLCVLPPPRGLMDDIQRALVDFFWSGQHWIRAPALYLPVEEGGQGLIDITSRVAAFRLRTAQRLMYDFGVRWLDTAKLIMKKAGRLGYSKQLFLLKLGEADLTGLSAFYASVLEAWNIFKVTRDSDATAGMWLFEEPLFFNGLLETQSLSSASLRTFLREAGCTKLGHLLVPMDSLQQRVSIRPRLLGRVFAEVEGSLPQHLRTFLVENSSLVEQWEEDTDYVFPTLAVSPNVGQLQEEEGSILSFSTPQLGPLEELQKKAMYILCVKVRHCESLQATKASKWTEFFGPGSSPKGSWRVLYKLPVEKRSADLQWRIVHGAIATNRHRAHIDPNQGEGCLFCSQTETLFHLFVECPRLAGVFDILRGWFMGMGEVFSHQLFIFGPMYSVPKKGLHTLMNFISATAKLSIWLSRRNRAQEVGCVDPVLIMKGLIKARLRVEHSYYKMVDNIEGFSMKWTLGGALCTVGHNNELILSF